MKDTLELQLIVDKKTSEPNVFFHCRACILEGATTRLEATAVEAMSVGGLQRTKYLSSAFLEFSRATGDASAAQTVHPSLFASLKKANVPSKKGSLAAASANPK